MDREKVVHGVAVALVAVMAAVGSAFVGTDSRLPSLPDAVPSTPPAVSAAAAMALGVPAVLEASPAAVATDPSINSAVEPASALLTPSVVSIGAEQRSKLAAEMSRWVTRHPRQLVEVIADLAEDQPLPLPPTFLLSIAWSETRGKILAVSPAGAAGLAQATPSAYLSENLGGKLYVTTDYLMGTRAFIMKKPLGDALAISGDLLEKNTPARRKQASELVAKAIELREEGIDELEALRPVANATFFKRIEQGKKHNLTTLRELDRIIDRGAPRAELARFDKRVQRDYTYLRNVQRNGWKRYERDLTNRRDTLLRKKYGQKPATIFVTRPYEAGEYLSTALDVRFSPTQMAKFLAAHLETKQEQARELGIGEEGLDAWTAALYNGGAVNIKRMRAGLIGSLTETQKYMKAVPARTARLERTLG